MRSDGGPTGRVKGVIALMACRLLGLRLTQSMVLKNGDYREHTYTLDEGETEFVAIDNELDTFGYYDEIPGKFRSLHVKSPAHELRPSDLYTLLQTLNAKALEVVLRTNKVETFSISWEVDDKGKLTGCKIGNTQANLWQYLLPIGEPIEYIFHF